MSIGEEIRKARKKKGYSQEQLAERTCVSRQTIYNWENDLIKPTAENIAALNAVLDIGINETDEQLKTAAADEKSRLYMLLSLKERATVLKVLSVVTPIAFILFAVASGVAFVMAYAPYDFINNDTFINSDVGIILLIVAIVLTVLLLGASIVLIIMSVKANKLLARELSAAEQEKQQ